MGEQVIVLTDLTKQYGNFTAVDHIRLHIQKGEIFGITGSERCRKINYHFNDVRVDRTDIGFR